MTCDDSIAPVIHVITHVYKHYDLCDIDLAVLRAHYIFKQIEEFSLQYELFLTIEMMRFFTLVYVLRSFNKQVYSYDGFISLLQHYNKDQADASLRVSAAALRELACAESSKSKMITDLFEADNVLAGLFRGDFGRSITLSVVDRWIQRIEEFIGPITVDAARVRSDLRQVIESTYIVNNSSIDIVCLLLVFLNSVDYEIDAEKLEDNKIYLIIQDEINVAVDVKAERTRVNGAFAELKKHFCE